MQAKREQWKYQQGARVWVGRYLSPHNMPHWHYDCEILYLVRGSMEVFCGQERFTLYPGQAAFVDSKQVHYMHALEEDTEDIIIVFDYDIIKPFAASLTLAHPLLSRHYDVVPLAEQLREKLLARRPYYEFETAHLVALKLIEIFRNEPTVTKNKGGTSAERVKALLEEIDKNFEFYTLESAAQFMSMNPAYFSRYFHKLTGMTFSQYLNYVKTEHAVRLLTENSDMPITEISIQCGFSTIRNFNRVFKDFTGYTPRSLPRHFVMKESFFNLNESSSNPNLQESVLLQSSDAV